MMTHKRTVTRRLSALAVVISGCIAATASAQVYETFSNFEFDAADFTIGDSPATARFTGGDSGTEFIPRFYHSGRRAWMVHETSPGLIQFETTATQVQFWAIDTDSTVNGLIEVFDAAGNLIDTGNVIETFQFFQFKGAIDHIVVTNQNGGLDTDVFIDDLGFNIERCLSLEVTNLVAGSDAAFSLANGTPCEMATVMYGDTNGTAIFMDFSGYCATLGFDIPKNQINSRIVVQGAFDQNGEMAMKRTVPNQASGMSLVFQAGEQNTCPDECISNMVTMEVQ